MATFTALPAIYYAQQQRGRFGSMVVRFCSERERDEVGENKQQWAAGEGQSRFIPSGRHGLGCTFVESDWASRVVLWDGVVG
jgi:hypothetical protein